MMIMNVVNQMFRSDAQKLKCEMLKQKLKLYGIIAAIIIIGRELIISAFRQIAAAKGIVMAADMWGKYKTTFQTIALPLLMLQAQVVASNWLTGNGLLTFQIVNYVLIGIATVLTIISGCNYIIKNKAVLKQEEKKDDSTKIESNDNKTK